MKLLLGSVRDGTVVARRPLEYLIDSSGSGSEQERLLIGRSRACAIWLQDPEVSSEHAIVVNGVLIDNQSTNGIALRKKHRSGKPRKDKWVRVSYHQLADGDEFCVGSTIFTVSSAPMVGRDLCRRAGKLDAAAKQVMDEVDDSPSSSSDESPSGRGRHPHSRAPRSRHRATMSDADDANILSAMSEMNDEMNEMMTRTMKSSSRRLGRPQLSAPPAMPYSTPDPKRRSSMVAKGGLSPIMDVDESGSASSPDVAGSPQSPEESTSVSREQMFVAQWSHEMRTPMVGVLGMADLLMQAAPTREQREYIMSIKQSGAHLLGIVNDLLDYTKLVEGKFTLHPAPFRVANTFKAIGDLMRFQAADKGVQLVFEPVQGVAAGVLVGDEMRVRQVLLNLVSNAVKFTPRDGTVRVRAELYDTRDASVRVLFSVSDTGCGIPKSKQREIFRKFSQADTAHSQCGTGLGLAISQQLVGLMGGRLRVQSEPGHGARFYFKARLELAEEGVDVPDARAEPHEQDVEVDAVDEIQRGTQARVLLAEDNIVNHKLAVRLLRKLGYEVVGVYDGKQAVEAYARDPTGFSCVLMDIEMPVMDGRTAAAAMRTVERKQGWPGIPIIALTAHAIDSIEGKCRRSGMDAFLSKPFDRAAVEAALLRWCSMRGQARRTMAGSCMADKRARQAVHEVDENVFEQ